MLFIFPMYIIEKALHNDIVCVSVLCFLFPLNLCRFFCVIIFFYIKYILFFFDGLTSRICFPFFSFFALCMCSVHTFWCVFPFFLVHGSKNIIIYWFFLRAVFRLSFSPSTFLGWLFGWRCCWCCCCCLLLLLLWVWYGKYYCILSFPFQHFYVFFFLSIFLFLYFELLNENTSEIFVYSSHSKLIQHITV